MKTIIIIFMFFLIGAFFIISENNLALKQASNIDKFLGLYSYWLSHIFDNTKGVSAYVIKMNWLPNQTGK